MLALLAAAVLPGAIALPEYEPGDAYVYSDGRVERVVRADGSVEVLGHIGSTPMQAGDLFEIHTPGGGGFGVAG